MDKQAKEPATIVFIKFPGDDELIHEHNYLGRFSYPKQPLKNGSFNRREIFEKLGGFVVLEEFINTGRMDILEKVQIYTERRKMTLDYFFDSITNADQIK